MHLRKVWRDVCRERTVSREASRQPAKMSVPDQTPFSHTLVEAMTRLHQDEDVPMVVPAETFASLHRLDSCRHKQDVPLLQFLMTVTSWEVSDAVLKSLLPASFHRLCEELEASQMEKEDAVGHEDFERALELVRHTDQIESKLRGFPNVTITSDDVIQALREIGYTGP